MKVQLIAHMGSDADISRIARVCTGREEVEYTPEQTEKLIHNLAERGHYSVFEHVCFTFEIDGISRACSLQLARHRHMSRTERSQRYVRLSNTGFIKPFCRTTEMTGEMEKALADAKRAYNNLLGLGMSPEDARMVLPEATTTKMFITLNLRTLRELCEKRADNPGAQWEIRELVSEMRGRAREVEELRFCVREMLNWRERGA